MSMDGYSEELLQYRSHCTFWLLVPWINCLSMFQLVVVQYYIATQSAGPLVNSSALSDDREVDPSIFSLCVPIACSPQHLCKIPCSLVCTFLTCFKFLLMLLMHSWPGEAWFSCCPSSGSAAMSLGFLAATTIANSSNAPPLPDPCVVSTRTFDNVIPRLMLPALVSALWC